MIFGRCTPITRQLILKNYLITFEDKTLLYALDTAWMCCRARKLIGKTFIDAIFWDATMSETGDWRIFEHSDLEMFDYMRKVWLENKIIDENVTFYFNLRARTLLHFNYIKSDAH